MPITVTCLGCSAQLTFAEQQAGILPLCPACAAKVSGPRRQAVALTTDAAKPEEDAGMGEGIRAEPAEELVPLVEPVEETSAEDLLELGPRWRQMQTAFAWVRFGVYALIMGLGIRSLLALFKVCFGGSDTILASVLPSLIFAAASFTLFIGQLLCLRVPAGTRARPAALAGLASRILAFGLSLYGALFLWEVKEITRWSGRSDLFTSLALFLGAWFASLLAEFSFVAFLKRVGRFLQDEAVVRHARRAIKILLAYLVVAFVLSAAGIAWMYVSVSGEIETYKLRFPRDEPQPLWWLLSRISDVFYPAQNASPGVALAQLGVTAVTAVFWLALGNEYWGALTSANATIRDGVARGAAG